ncbi:MAG: Melibiose operon regulatory protein [Candidatus Celerinatantimonas neptuna]|nr:MAG: Melibiose operon regulatory protein [Candidatus Celerinatantimonas neptuna]
MPYQVEPVELQALTQQACLHSHDHHQIVLGLQGYTEFTIDGIQNKVSKGQGVMVTAGSAHKFRGTKQNKILVFNLPLKNHFFSTDIYQRILPLLSNPGYFQLDQQIQNVITRLAIEISHHPYDTLLKRACGDTLLCLLEHHFLPIYQNINNKNSHKKFNLELLNQYVTSRLEETITVANLASHVFLGESQFYARFKRQTGKTPLRYVTGLRIEHAKTLLVESEERLEQVAYHCGFASQSSFTHVFRRLTGYSPGQYRKTQFSS